MIADFVEAFLPRLNSHYGRSLTIEDIIHYDFAQVLEVAREEMDDFFIRVGEEGIYRELQVIEGAGETLSILAQRHSIKLITFRLPRLREDTEHWLRVNNIPFDEVLYLGYQDKAQHVRECDIFIEDSLEAALKVAARGVDVLLFDYPWNRNLDPYRESYPEEVIRLIHRIYTWNEIMDYIRKREIAMPAHCKGGVKNG